MQLNLPLFTFVAHFPASLVIGAIKSYAKGDWETFRDDLKFSSAKSKTKEAVKAIAMGTLFSIAIAMGTPKFHSTFSSIPSPLRNRIIVSCHLLASTAGLHLWEALGLDDSKQL